MHQKLKIKSDDNDIIFLLYDCAFATFVY